jgi:hypothetical protein
MSVADARRRPAHNMVRSVSLAPANQYHAQNVLPDFAARRSRIFSAITRSAGSSEASGLGTALCSVALAGPVVVRARQRSLRATHSEGTVRAEDVSVEARPACDASVGTAAKFLPCAKKLNRTARIKARTPPTKMQSRRGPPLDIGTDVNLRANITGVRSSP